MSTLLLRLAAPLQAWGTDSKFDIRKTGGEPTKSGVVGLLAAALGRRRDEALDDLNALRFGVRVDREGQLLRDFHMVHKGTETSYITTRYYLSDAAFLVGLESEDVAFLKKLSEAVQSPQFPLFLGRRACPPTLPLCLGIRNLGLMAALSAEPPLTALDEQADWIRFRLDCGPSEFNSARVWDEAISFNPAHRRYRQRMVIERRLKRSVEIETEHDPMSELGGGSKCI